MKTCVLYCLRFFFLALILFTGDEPSTGLYSSENTYVPGILVSDCIIGYNLTIRAGCRQLNMYDDSESREIAGSFLSSQAGIVNQSGLR